MVGKSLKSWMYTVVFSTLFKFEPAARRIFCRFFKAHKVCWSAPPCTLSGCVVNANKLVLDVKHFSYETPFSYHFSSLHRYTQTSWYIHGIIGHCCLTFFFQTIEKRRNPIKILLKIQMIFFRGDSIIYLNGRDVSGADLVEIIVFNDLSILFYSK